MARQSLDRRIGALFEYWVIYLVTAGIVTFQRLGGRNQTHVTANASDRPQRV